ncbi:MAG: hypothetical protein V3U39_11280 [Acidimicrobiia bacterium]
MSYLHTQRAPSSVMYIGGALMGVIVVGSLFSGRTGSWAVSILLAVIFVIAMSVFGLLTVEVDDTALQASFGWGWPRKRLELSTASAARIVGNRLAVWIRDPPNPPTARGGTCGASTLSSSTSPRARCCEWAQTSPRPC